MGTWVHKYFKACTILIVLVGPTIGGLLAKPADSFAAFKGTHFEDFPYALPCMVSATFSIIGLVTGFSFLPETLIKDEGVKDEGNCYDNVISN
jgi:hypothetical protein